MIRLIIASIGMLLMSAAKADDAACAECMHIDYELRGVPELYSHILDNALSSLANPACASNTVERQTCEALQFPAWMEHKCLTTTVTLSASNLQGLMPNAELDVTTTLRGCHAQWKGEEGGCINFSELDADTRAQMTAQLASLSQQWGSVEYTGELCIESP